MARFFYACLQESMVRETAPMTDPRDSAATPPADALCGFEV
jgi:hypothetical protein